MTKISERGELLKSAQRAVESAHKRLGQTPPPTNSEIGQIIIGLGQAQHYLRIASGAFTEKPINAGAVRQSTTIDTHVPFIQPKEPDSTAEIQPIPRTEPKQKPTQPTVVWQQPKKPPEPPETQSSTRQPLHDGRREYKPPKEKEAIDLKEKEATSIDFPELPYKFHTQTLHEIVAFLMLLPNQDQTGYRYATVTDAIEALPTDLAEKLTALSKRSRNDFTKKLANTDPADLENQVMDFAQQVREYDADESYEPRQHGNEAYDFLTWAQLSGAYESFTNIQLADVIDRAMPFKDIVSAYLENPGFAPLKKDETAEEKLNPAISPAELYRLAGLVLNLDPKHLLQLNIDLSPQTVRIIEGMQHHALAQDPEALNKLTESIGPILRRIKRFLSDPELYLQVITDFSEKQLMSLLLPLTKLPITREQFLQHART